MELIEKHPELLPFFAELEQRGLLEHFINDVLVANWPNRFRRCECDVSTYIGNAGLYVRSVGGVIDECIDFTKARVKGSGTNWALHMRDLRSVYWRKV